MGCGKSKHDVATENTITRKKSMAAGSGEGKDIDTFYVAQTKDDMVQQEEKKENVGIELEGENPAGVADVKDIAEDKELKGGVGGGTEMEASAEEEAGRLVSRESPNRFFSSRKDEEDGGEGLASEKSEYNSPHVDSGKESFFNESAKILEDHDVLEKTLVRETKHEITKIEGEAGNVEDKSSVKEENCTPAAATLGSSSPPRHLTPNVDQNQNAPQPQEE